MLYHDLLPLISTEMAILLISYHGRDDHAIMDFTNVNLSIVLAIALLLESHRYTYMYNKKSNALSG